MATQLGENTQAKLSLAFMAKVIGICGTAVWGYSVVWNKLNTVEMSVERVSHESTLLGDMAARVANLEKYVDQSHKDLEHLLEMQDEPITSDHQQFERIHYLEKELDIVRQKLDQMEWK